MTGRILVATHGGASTTGALRYARALAERDGSAVEVVAVALPVMPPPFLPLDGASYVSMLDSSVTVDDMREAVVAQLSEVGGIAASWTPTIELGPIVPAIVDRAHAIRAALILVGAGQRGRAERLMGGETAVRLMHASDVPVLSVPANARGLPTTAVAATDFSSFSRDAALAAARIVGRSGRLHLVHVMWPLLAAEGMPGEGEWSRTYRTGAEHRLAEMAAGLADETGAEVRTHLAAGDAAKEILELSESTGADLIAVGSHGLGFFGRIAMGSISTAVVRAAPCAVLVAPPPDPARELRSAEAARVEALDSRRAGSGAAG